MVLLPMIYPKNPELSTFEPTIQPAQNFYPFITFPGCVLVCIHVRCGALLLITAAVDSELYLGEDETEQFRASKRRKEKGNT